jgi:hypothetical protein
MCQQVLENSPVFDFVKIHVVSNFVKIHVIFLELIHVNKWDRKKTVKQMSMFFKLFIANMPTIDVLSQLLIAGIG